MTIRLTVTTEIKTRKKLDGIKAHLAVLSSLSAGVGWFSPSPRHKYFGDKGQILNDPRMSVVDIATVHEYGSPARGIIHRPIHGKSRDLYKGKIEGFTRPMIAKLYSGKMPPQEIIDHLGKFWADKMKGVFTDANGWHELDSTYLKWRQKFVSHTMPLMATNQLRDTIEHRTLTAGHR